MDDANRPTPAPAESKTLYRYRFGSAEFDEARIELRVSGLVVETQLKPLQLLSLLIGQAGEVVSKDRIAQVVWSELPAGEVPSDAMIANAVSKLRAALGEDNAARIATVPRAGYRFDGSIERLALGRRAAPTAFALEVGQSVPGRDNYRLERRLGGAHGNELWLARQPRSNDARVFKFALDERLADLKREVTLSRLLGEALGPRDDLVRVLDWNFEQSPYWIEQEFSGDSLDHWADAATPQGRRLDALTLDERVGLLAAAADAVAAAHAVGVLHQDLKPANMLIAAHGAGWQIRLTDFGSARLIDGDALHALQITQLGLTVASLETSSSTPWYAAPELLRGERPTTRCDVFALGIVLYQLVAGDFKRPLVPGWERDVPDELLREDIAAATDQEAARRLPSAAEFAERLRMRAQRRQIRAQQRAEAEHRLAVEQRLARADARRPWVIAAGVALVLGTATSAGLYLRERAAADTLAHQVAVSQALNRLLREDLIGSASPAKNGRAGITVADALVATAAHIDEKFGNESPAVRGSLHAAVQSSLSDLSRATEAVDEGRRAIAALEAAGPAQRADLQSARLRLALDLVQVSQLDEARQIVAAIERDSGTGAPLDVLSQVRLLYVKSWVTAGDLSLQESTQLLEQALQLAQQTPDFDAQARRVVAFALADNYAMLERFADAERLYRGLQAEQLVQYGAKDARTLYTAVGLGRTLMLEGRHAEALPVLQDAAQGLATALGPTHRQALTARDQLAELRFRERDYAGAAQDWAQVKQGFAVLLGAGSSYTVTVQTNLATALHYAGDPHGAEHEFTDALSHARAFLKDSDPQTQQIRYALADCLLDQGAARRAQVLLTGLEPAQLQAAQPRGDWAARLDYQRARAALALGDHALAHTLSARAQSAGVDADGHLDAKRVAALVLAAR